MKKRLRHKLAKKRKLSDFAPQSNASIANGNNLQNIAVECWRLQQLMLEISDHRKQPVFRASIERIADALHDAGVEIEDPLGLKYVDGMTVAVQNLGEAQGRTIVETLSPTVYIHGVVVHPAQVILGNKNEEWLWAEPLLILALILAPRTA